MADVLLQDVGLRFAARRSISLKEVLLRRAKPRRTYIDALQGVCLHVAEGERLGLIGHNGAGKSTLLRLIAGVYAPTQGRCRVDGRVSSLFGLAVGFEPDATGWENIRLRMYLQGETPASVHEHIDQIAEFSELGEALDRPVRYYSDGMLVRLAFSIATTMEPEILIVDEVLGAGDLSFHAKAQQRITELVSLARIVIAASHDLDTLSKSVDKIAWLDHGRIIAHGEADWVIEQYRLACAPDSLARAA